ncbi:MAG: glutamate-1-semialdehyde 2,1-aminomutase [Candidatus Krumholzibacteria bacterium]|jgi:glutamate-1-semialdehyde 2,1-aminomutase|nr:glutamate-1-semialdehyde 2,1-aminomutase [Candidatus Krumholzibacteria bacterium]
MNRAKLSRERSSTLYRRACELMPAGVNSPVRAFGAVPGDPLFIARADGAYLWDADSNRYLDCCGSWGPLILGHGHPRVLAAIEAAVRRGTTYGAPCEAEIELAERVIAAYPGLELVRFVSSGTEAVMSAVRLARGFTGRHLIVKFSGCYHGHSDALLVSGGSGLATFGVSSSAGVPPGAVADTVVLPLDDEQLVADLFAERGTDIAAVVIEPLPANAGLLPQRPEYLRFLRDVTRQHGALLVFDEVISGFRLGMDGAAGFYGVAPDLATFGKIIGGGMPVGAFGGRREIMTRLAPLGDVYQAGTLSGNPVAMSAGAAALRVLQEQRVHERLEELGSTLADALAGPAAKAGCTLVRAGSIFWLAMQPEAPRRVEAVDGRGMQRYAALHEAALEQGVYLAPSGWEVGFLNAAMQAEEVQKLGATLAELI